MFVYFSFSFLYSEFFAVVLTPAVFEISPSGFLLRARTEELGILVVGFYIQLLEYPIPPRPRPRHKNPDPRVFNGSRKPSNIIDPLVSKRLEKI